MLGVDAWIEHVIISPFAVVAMLLWLFLLSRDVLKIRRSGRGRLPIGPIDAILFFALFALLASRAYLFFDEVINSVDKATILPAVRTYNAVFVIVATACSLSSAMPARFARLALSLSRRPALLLSGSFLILIAMTTLTLVLPPALSDVHDISLLDALFTATSAVCVTGLTVNDVAQTYSHFGHFAILLAIQLGGIGIMTLAALTLTFGRSRSLTTELHFADMLDAHSLAELRQTVRSVVYGTLAIEASGAFALWLLLRNHAAIAGASPVFIAIFHAVSAFCNAGFALFPGNLTPFVEDFAVQGVFIVLIVCGGLGFPVIAELADRTWNRIRSIVPAYRAEFRPHLRISLTTRVVLWTSLLLTFAGATILLALEWNGEAMGSLSIEQRFMAALFASVQTRTAGFNTVDLGVFSPAALLVMCVLMFIGGSPGSTAGGIKTTTFAVILAALRGEVRGEEPRIGARSISPEIFRKAIAVAAIASSFVLASFFALLLSEDAEFSRLLFEVVSAFGTVGVSTGITSSLTPVGKLVICATMFVGRIGPLTLALALSRGRTRPHFRLASENLPIG
jgi:trk system potassium uptake protein TrkH